MCWWYPPPAHLMGGNDHGYRTPLCCPRCWAPDIPEVHIRRDGDRYAFPEIGAIAKLTLLAMETEAIYRQPELIAQALRTIWVKTEDMERGINDRAGSVGFDHRDEPAERRADAFRSAKLHTHQALRSALAVVSSCNADGAFNAQEQAIRAALKVKGDAACPRGGAGRTSVSIHPACHGDRRS